MLASLINKIHAEHSVSSRQKVFINTWSRIFSLKINSGTLTYPSSTSHTRPPCHIPEFLVTYPTSMSHTRPPSHIPDLQVIYPSSLSHTRPPSQIPELTPYPSSVRTRVTYPSYPHPTQSECVKTFFR